VVAETGRGQANISKQLKVLAEAGLVTRRKKGLQVFYRLGDPLVERLCQLACETIAQEAQAEIEQNRKLLHRWEAK
jgi:DNA-binding transcriptional ArsR family regulator